MLHVQETISIHPLITFFDSTMLADLPCNRRSTRSMLSLAITTLLVISRGAHACSRVAYKGADEQSNNCVIVGRSMDWAKPTNSSIWAFPAGLQREGAAGKNSLKWNSKYGSVITTMYDVATVDGINSAGLVGNTLYLADGNYGKRDSTRPGLSIGLWEQYFLDNYATVQKLCQISTPLQGPKNFKLLLKNTSREYLRLAI